MPCNCGKKNPRRWQPRVASAKAEPAPSASHRIVPPSEQAAERDNGLRPPRAQQPRA